MFSRFIAVFGGLALAGQLMVPSVHGSAMIGGQTYMIDFIPDLIGPVGSGSGVEMRRIASAVHCPYPAFDKTDAFGSIEVDASLPPVAQAKAMIHETVHIAQTCDQRNLAVDEKIAQDIADLLNSGEGRFIVKELQ